MSSDHQLQATLDRVLSALRGQLEAGLRAYTEELTKASTVDRTRAVEKATEEVRRHAQEQLAQLRETAKKQNDDVRRSAETQIAELRRLLEDLRRTAQQQIDTMQRTLDTELVAARAKASSEIDDARRVAQSHAEDVQRAADARLKEAARELDELTRELSTLRQQLADEQSRAARRPAAEESGVAEEVRRIDESGSLADVLERLTDAAVSHADRAALLMLSGDRLREWRTVGFGGRTPAGRADFSLDQAGIAATAAREGRVLTRGASEPAPLPPFATGANTNDVAVFPVTVAGTVVAVLYAEASADESRLGRWASDLEVLARHAGRVLEAIAIQQAAGLRPVTAVARPSHTGREALPVAGGRQ